MTRLNPEQLDLRMALSERMLKEFGRVMSDRDFQTCERFELYGLSPEKVQGQGPITRHPETPQIQPAPVLKLIIRQAAYFLLLMLAIGAGLAVLL